MESGGLPSQDGDRELRASDAEREGTISALREHFAAGRLSDEEFIERSAEVYGAKTVAQLDGLVIDLPSPAPPRPLPSPRRRSRAGRALATSVRIHLTVYLLVNLMLVVIWAVTGGGYFWPVWPLLGWGIGVGSHAAPLLAGVGNRAIAEPSPETGTITEIESHVRAERRSLDAASAPDGTVTILFSDIEGSTELNHRLGDERWLRLLLEHHKIVRREVDRHGGFEVKAQGDGFMIAFPGARQAAQCALAIQAAVQTELGGHPDGPIRIRIGLHAGDSLREDDDFYGVNVALAARIAECAGAGEVLASAVVKQLAQSGGDLVFEHERVVELKGLGEHTIWTVTRAASYSEPQ
jgi:class 3 adenylate cyclase